MNDAKKSAIEKLAKMGLTEEEVLSLFVEDKEETIVEENGDNDESKSWQQIVMEEHVGYYNKRYNVNLTFDEYYEGVTSGKIEVHYNWKQMLGLEEQTPIPIDPSKNIKTEKFKKHGN